MSRRDTRVRTGKGVRSRDVTDDIGVSEARRRYGGLDVPATVAGTLAALGTAVLLGGILAAAGSFGYQQDVSGETISVAGLIAGLATLLVAFLVGGWVAGRIARYDGGRNGLMTALWFVVLAAVAAALGAWAGSEYDVFADVELPQWFSDEATSWQAIVTGVAALVVMFVAGFIGGKLGERYHRRADAVITHTRSDGLHTDAQYTDGQYTDGPTDPVRTRPGEPGQFDLADGDDVQEGGLVAGPGTSTIEGSRDRTGTAGPRRGGAG